MEQLFQTSGKLAETLGIAALLFFSVIIMGIIIYVILEKEAKKWEQRERHMKQVYQSLIDQVSADRKQDYDLLKATLDDNRDQISIMRGLVERTKQMQVHTDQAFRDLFDKLSRILENRCISHFQKS